MPKIPAILTLLISLSIVTPSVANSPEPNDRKFTFSYEFEIAGIPADTKQLEIWTPLPSCNENQTIANLRIDSKLPYREVTDPEYGNSLLNIVADKNIPSNLIVTMSFDVCRSEACKFTSGKSAKSNDTTNLERFLAADVLVPIDGEIAREANSILRTGMTDIDKIRALYDHLTQTLEYDKTGDGWGNGDALYACDARKGNCTDIHSLFIGMARAIGIPARFVIGFPLPDGQSTGEIPGYHCWAEFYLSDRGWIPVDISEAIKHPEKKEYFFGSLDHDRISFTTGRDIKLSGAAGQETLNYFIYPHILIDGKPFFGASFKFSFTDKNEISKHN